MCIFVISFKLFLEGDRNKSSDFKLLFPSLDFFKIDHQPEIIVGEQTLGNLNNLTVT